jgi:hypothetical protein
LTPDIRFNSELVRWGAKVGYRVAVADFSLHDVEIAETLRHAFQSSFDIGVIQDPVQPLHSFIGVDGRPIPIAREFGLRVEQSLGDDLDIPQSPFPLGRPIIAIAG